MTIYRYNRAAYFSTFFMLLFLLISFLGCGRDTDVVRVDFSKKLVLGRTAETHPRPLAFRVAVSAMISPKETFVYYHQLLEYIAVKFDREVQLIQRKTYRDINELLGSGQIDLAFICSGPYITGKERYGFEALAIPRVKGSHSYHSYLIVNNDSPYKNLADLKGRIFAYTDPESNTGKLVPTYWLSQMGEDTKTFFEKTIFTYSHDNSILAVAKALVDGAAVDSLIWDYYNQRSNLFTSKTRIIKRSEPYGIPPIVASRFISTELKDRIRKMLFTMHQDPEGQSILGGLMIDKFESPREEWYETIRRMKMNLALHAEKNYASTKL